MAHGMIIEEDIGEAIAGVTTSNLSWSPSASVTVVDSPVYSEPRVSSCTTLSQVQLLSVGILAR